MPRLNKTCNKMKQLMEASAPASSQCIVKPLVTLRSQAAEAWSYSSCLMLICLQPNATQPTETIITETASCLMSRFPLLLDMSPLQALSHAQEGKSAHNNVPDKRCSRKEWKVIVSSGTWIWWGGMKEATFLTAYTVLHLDFCKACS